MTEARLGNQYRCAITDADGNVIYSESAELRTVTKKWSYAYDSDGLRTAKSDGATNYEYIYDGDKLVQMNVGTDTLRFAYDGSTPMTVTFNGAVYYYITNLQGDIIAILDSSGSKVVEYTYNAWGLPLSTTGTLASTLGTKNPLRYRGYVYDTDTQLYYCQSRYYDPALGRFLNADAFASTGQGIIGNNMFAYCNNNPVNYEDSLGFAFKHIREKIIDGGKIPQESESSSPVTVSAGVSGSITLGPFTYGIQLALVTDSYGYSELQATYFSPISSDALRHTPSTDEMFAKIASFEKFTDILEFSLMGNVSIYNVPSVENLYNTGYQFGGTLGAGGAIAVDYNVVPNGLDNPYRGITFSGGIGSNDIHAAMSNTVRLFPSRISVYDLAEAAQRGLYGGY